MSRWSDFLDALRGKKPQVLPPVVAAREVHVAVVKPSGAFIDMAPAAIITGTIGTDAWTSVGTPISGRVLAFTLPESVVYGETASIEIHADPGYLLYTARVVLAPDINVTMQAIPPAHVTRMGLIRVVGHVFVDDQGPFHPLGDTLLHAVGTWQRGGAGRIRQHAAYFAQFNHDYVRILCQVDWANEPVVASWPALGHVIDALYEYGLRSKLTITGGGANPREAARQVANAIVGRQHKIFLVEAVNEGNASEADAVAMCEIIRPTGVLYAVGLGDQGIDTIRRATIAAQAPVSVFHTERGNGDPHEPGGIDARKVRQVWDLPKLSGGRENAEPPGPGSSVATLDDPFKLATFRAASIICGSGAFCLHTGSGVFGRPMDGAYGHRYANVWEIPNIDTIMQAVKLAERRLPVDIENWTPFNTQHPIETSMGECNKIYGARAGSPFVSMMIGCTGGAQALTAKQAISVKVYNPMTGDQVAGEDLNAGGTLMVSGLWAYLCVGTVR